MSEYVKNRVIELFGEGKLYCAESVLKVIAEAGDKDSDDLIRMATGFCSGASRTSGQCGAVSGAIMGIGLYAGRSGPEDDYDPAYAMVQEFLARFTEKCGSINCYDLIKCDFATQEGQERFKEKRLLRKCILYAVFAAETAIEILREQEYLPEHEDHIKSRLAPCGLSCGKCLAYAGGPIQQLSVALGVELGENFAQYAKRFEGMDPVFKNYAQFKELLDFLAQGSCSGCRENGCLFKECRVTICVKEKGVDYCYQCDDFPCDRHGMPEGLAERWQDNNEKMQELGLEAWFCGCKERPRYP
ncbi:C-GCAxxG-C-C family protein [Pseudodesulfovibrio sp.]|nr:C-GCAxxG-C-C family protein [Pseudodesulfovibrio sp.]